MNDTLPSRAEALQAEYGGEYEIYREYADGAHGDWIARRWDGTGTEHRATDISGLHALLEGDK